MVRQGWLLGVASLSIVLDAPDLRSSLVFFFRGSHEGSKSSYRKHQVVCVPKYVWVKFTSVLGGGKPGCGYCEDDVEC